MDDQDLCQEHVQVLWDFIIEDFLKLNSHPDCYDSFLASFIPEKIFNFYNQCPLSMGLECPVCLGCKTYDKEEGTVKQCGKRGVVKYCNQDC